MSDILSSFKWGQLLLHWIHPNFITSTKYGIARSNNQEFHFKILPQPCKLYLPPPPPNSTTYPVLTQWKGNLQHFTGNNLSNAKCFLPNHTYFPYMKLLFYSQKNCKHLIINSCCSPKYFKYFGRRILKIVVYSYSTYGFIIN